jgi:magnesium-protoporphyrin IX monomethyl ester (oxidative) cyclase
MPDVVLVNPHWYMAEGNLDDLWLPVPGGLLAVAAAVRASGYSVAMLDVLAEGYEQREWTSRAGRHVCRVGLSDQVIVEKLRASGARVVGIGNMFTGIFRGTQECAELARQALPGAKIVLGGVHPSCAPEESAAIPAVDYVVHGEGENSFPALLSHLLKGAADVPPGLYWKEKNAVRTSGLPEMILDIDSLPMPAYDLLDLPLYRRMAEKAVIQRGEKVELTMPVITSRGCPFHCIFCAAHRLNGRHWRGRSPSRVVDEIEFLYRQYGVRSFSIEDSNFTYDEERAFNICEEILRRGLKIRWNTPNGLRADRITPRLVDAMKRAGCYEITLAAEHGDQEFLSKVIRKGLDLESIFRVGVIIRKAGLSVTCFLMMGFPGETEKELNRTLIFGRRLARAGIFPLCFICSPYPGTDLYPAYREQEDRKQMPSGYEDYLCAMRFSMIDMPAGVDLARWRHKAMWQWYGLLLFWHPVVFFRLPAVRKLLRAFRSLKTCRLALKKLYNQFALRPASLQPGENSK